MKYKKPQVKQINHLIKQSKGDCTNGTVAGFGYPPENCSTGSRAAWGAEQGYCENGLAHSSCTSGVSAVHIDNDPA